MPQVIAISGVSAAGKSTLVRALANVLNATAIFWDDYEKISKEPSDYFEWFKSDRNYDAWKYDALVDILKTLKGGKSVTCPATGRKLAPTKYILVEAPLGRKHMPTSHYIDCLIFLDIEPDIALARRLLREYSHSKNAADILNELKNYLTFSRPMYIWSHEAKSEADLVIDANLPLEEQVQLTISFLEPQ